MSHETDIKVDLSTISSNLFIFTERYIREINVTFWYTEDPLI